MYIFKTIFLIMFILIQQSIWAKNRYRLIDCWENKNGNYWLGTNKLTIQRESDDRLILNFTNKNRLSCKESETFIGDLFHSEIGTFTSDISSDTIVVWAIEKNCFVDTKQNLTFNLFYLNNGSLEKIARIIPEEICIACSFEDYLYEMMYFVDKKSKIRLGFNDLIEFEVNGKIEQTKSNSTYFIYDKKTKKVKIHWP